MAKTPWLGWTAGLLLGPLIALLPERAAADLQVCNQTGELQSIALGFKGDTDWASRGWWNIEPGACAKLIEGELTRRYYYYFADSRRGGFRGQDYIFCIKNTAFDVLGDTNCEGRGLLQESFREIDTGERATTYTLTLQSDKGSSSGSTAKAPGGGGSGGDVGVQTVTDVAVIPDLSVDLASLTTDLTEGRYGEPFAQEALFQGCELQDRKAFCSFHSAGVKMRVYYGGPTPDTLLFALEGVRLNTPVYVSGDTVETRGQERAIVVRSVRPSQTGDKHATMRAALQGDWVSESDRASEITIRGSEIYVRYSGEFQITRFLSMSDRCDGLAGSGPVMVQTTTDGKDATCYRIREAGQRLVLQPVRSGGVLRFRRQ